MTRIMVFHHAQGLTAGIVAFADTLREAGHTVHAPDLYDGNTFDTLEAGVDYAKTIGFATITKRAVDLVEALAGDALYLGFSLGVGPAQQLAQTRKGSLGAILVSACMARSEFSASWPADVPVQIHGKEHDPEFDNGWDLPAAEAIVAEASDAELFLYSGDEHLFADNSLSSYDADAAQLLTSRILAFLERIDSRG